MIDAFETTNNQGNDCRKHSDCDSYPNANDGFCDSFIGYKCSTKCTSNDQCMPDENYHFVCRGDGRCAPDTFETVWEVPSSNPTVTILLKDAQKCDFEINWGDVMGCDDDTQCGFEKIQSCDKDLTHTYQAGGKYHIKIQGVLDGFHASTRVNADNNIKDKCLNLIEVVSFGPVAFGRTNGSELIYGLANAPNLTKLSSIDIPDASKLTSLRAMFQKSKAIDDANIAKWDVSNVTDFAWAFSEAENFNQDISKWDTSKVSNMHRTFDRATAFNQPIGGWDVSNVTNMSYTFNGATSFNQELDGWTESTQWNTENVTDMSHMFEGATAFNQTIQSWNTAKVTNMSYMFASATTFNTYIGGWNTENVTNMSHMFEGATTFNIYIGGWNTENVTNMSYMFAGASKFNQYLANLKLDGIQISDNIQDIFKDSGLTKDNYCNLFFGNSKNKWLEFKSFLGLPDEYHCP